MFTIQAQVLYDLQNLGVISGDEMHNFFEEELGDPRPSGNVHLDEGHVIQFLLAVADRPGVAAIDEVKK